MPVVNITKEQAQYLRALHDAKAHAVKVFDEALALLSLGHVPSGSKLSGIDTQYGTLMFEEPVNDR